MLFSCTKKKDQRGDFNLKGNVKHVEIVSYSLKKDKSILERSKETILLFKKGGGLQKEEYIDFLKKTKKTYSYDYNIWNSNFTVKEFIDDSLSVIMKHFISKNALIDSVIYVKNKSLIMKSYYNYISNEEYEINTFDDNNDLLYRQSFLDKKNDNLSIEYIYFNGVRIKKTFTNDLSGNAIKAVILNRYNERDEYEYKLTFDDNKNWIEKRTFLNGSLYSKEERKITYY
jgi:hypothetical protein